MKKENPELYYSTLILALGVSFVVVSLLLSTFFLSFYMTLYLSKLNEAVAFLPNNANNGVTNEYRFVMKWGSPGAGAGQFIGPFGIALDSSDQVYVLDSGNLIHKFTPDGKFVTRWSSQSSESGQTSKPTSIAVDPLDNVYVSDKVNPVVKKFTSSNGTFIGGWGKIEPKANVSEGSLNLPTGIDIDPSGNVYLVDQELDKVQIYDLDGLLKETIGRNVTFEQLSGIAANRLEEFYVIDEGDHSIKKLQNDGTYITKWGNLGSEDGQFSKPTSIAVDPSGNIYVADGGNNRIQKFSNNGTFITKWGSQGVGDGEFNNPKDISIDSSGKVYVADTGNNRIQVFSASNNTLS